MLIVVTMKEKVLSHRQFSAFATGGQGSLPPFWFTKNTFLEHHVTTRKPTMMKKGKITFNPTYLTKVTYISSILMFRNTERLVVQVSNTRFNIQTLHL